MSDVSIAGRYPAAAAITAGRYLEHFDNAGTRSVKHMSAAHTVANTKRSAGFAGETTTGATTRKVSIIGPGQLVKGAVAGAAITADDEWLTSDGQGRLVPAVTGGTNKVVAWNGHAATASGAGVTLTADVVACVPFILA